MEQTQVDGEKKRGHNRTIHLMYVPFTGLGMYGGFRGNRWLRNRIKIFQQFVFPSLLNQTKNEFTLWISWRPEEKTNKYVQEFKDWLELRAPFKIVHTFHGVCFWDDKYSDQEARNRLMTALHGTMGELIDVTGGEKEYDWVLMTIQPSDDCYHEQVVETLQQFFAETDFQAFGFHKGFVMNYQTKELREWNPTTNPPFFTIKFPRPIFIDPTKHMEYTGPYKSHEYIVQKLKYATSEDRGFLVGTHGENISTVFNHPFTGPVVNADVLEEFGLEDVSPLKIPISLRKKILRRLPQPVQKKLRYYLGELIWNRIYAFLRN